MMPTRCCVEADSFPIAFKYGRDNSNVREMCSAGLRMVRYENIPRPQVALMSLMLVPDSITHTTEMDRDI